MSNRQRVVDLATQQAGITVTTGKDKYIALLGPGETPAMQQYFCDPKTSGCALTIRGMWRLLGVKDKRVNPAYVFGKAVTWLVAIARDRGAWVSAKVGTTPQPGDFVLVGGNPTTDGGVEHVFTVLTVAPQPDGTVLLTSVDGGQRDAKGNQSIFQKTRRWAVRNGAYWDVSAAGSDPGSNAPGGRKVMGWGDIEKILGAEAPLKVS